MRFDQIVYFTGDPRGDFPVRRRCPTWYERDTDRRPAHPAEFQADSEFLERVTPWLGEVAGTVPSPFGTIERLISAGFLVDKPNSEHNVGRAMDIDEITWSNAMIRPKDIQHESSDVTQVRRYIGLDAICRSHFPVVLGGDMSAGPDSWRQWLHEVARAALRGEAFWAFEADAAG